MALRLLSLTADVAAEEGTEGGASWRTRATS
jgi:hypothetical protein